MLEILVALDISQKQMKDQFLMEPPGAKVRRAGRKHWWPSRTHRPRLARPNAAVKIGRARSSLDNTASDPQA